EQRLRAPAVRIELDGAARLFGGGRAVFADQEQLREVEMRLRVLRSPAYGLAIGELRVVELALHERLGAEYLLLVGGAGKVTGVELERIDHGRAGGGDGSGFVFAE